MGAEIGGRPVVVTGGGSGIGAALATEAAARGAATVVVADVDLAAAEAVAAGIAEGGGAGVAYACDVTEPTEVEEMAAAVFTAHGPPGLVCANAGVMSGTATMFDTDPVDAAWVVSVNTLGAFHTLHAFGRRMQAEAVPGWLMATGSEHSLGVPHPFAAPYTASKHAVLGLCDVLRTELPDHLGISVLCPGITGSRLWNAAAHRPDRFGGPVEADPAAGGFMTEVGMDAATVAARALDGAEAGRFLVPTHYNARVYAERRWGEVAEAFDRLAEIDTTDYDVGTLVAGLTDPTDPTED